MAIKIKYFLIPLAVVTVAFGAPAESSFFGRSGGAENETGRPVMLALILESGAYEWVDLPSPGSLDFPEEVAAVSAAAHPLHPLEDGSKIKVAVIHPDGSRELLEKTGLRLEVRRKKFP